MRFPGRILIVDSEPGIADAMARTLGQQGYSVKVAGTLRNAIELLTCYPIDLVFADLTLPDGSGTELLARVKTDLPRPEVIFTTAQGSIDVAIEAIKEGAFYYIEKPFSPVQVLSLARGAMERMSSIRTRDATVWPHDDERTYGMIGASPGMRVIYDTIRATADSDASVLLEGESGTGKELIATAFHTAGSRSVKPFVHINCAAIPGELIESELFGYKRGAFTGADRDKRGLIEAAAEGTLLLDEITEMPLHLQAKLLRVLQERKLRRLGDEREIEVHFRLVSATNRDTAQAMTNGSLREDLYFRIGTIKINVPPLRDRLGDLELLANHFLRTYAIKYKKSVAGMSERVMEALARYAWPGNVRELESVIERAILFSQTSVLTAEDLPENIRIGSLNTRKWEIPPFLTLEEIEREAIAQTLSRTRGNVKKAAQELHIHRPTFYRKLKRYGLLGFEDHNGGSGHP